MTQPPIERPETPAATWRELRRGNERFIAGQPQHPRQDVDHRTSLAHAQRPLVAIFGCSDSRLSAEIIFDVGLGDAFVVRNAGQVISDSVLGSLEYAVGVLGVPLILVLGHDECGAVRAAIDSQGPDAAPLPAHISKIVDRIVPPCGASPVAMPTRRSNPPTSTPRSSVASICATPSPSSSTVSEMISDAIAAGTLAIVGANYRLFEGRAETDIVVGRI